MYNNKKPCLLIRGIKPEMGCVVQFVYFLIQIQPLKIHIIKNAYFRPNLIKQKMKYTSTFFLSIIGIFLLQSCKQQTNWYQYLGPDRNAVVSSSEILDSWDEKSPKKLWSFPLGEGFGGASVFKSEVFILDREKGLSDILRCIDIKSGEELWNYKYSANGELPFPGSRAVPTVNKKYVWSVGPHGDLYCFNKKLHQPVWHYNLKEKYDAKITQWGYSQSPILYKNLIIVAPHGNKAGVVAFEKASGEVVWESRPLTGVSYHASPTPAKFGGVDQIIMISPYDRKDSTKRQEVVSFDAISGNELWKYEGLRSFSTISPAVVIDDKRLFITDCSYNDQYGPVSILLEITKEGGQFNVKELFLTEEAGCKLHPGIFYKDHFYLNSTGNPNQMACLDLHGNSVWKNDSIPGFELGGMILINELIINQNGKNGDIHLIQPSAEGYKELGKASFFDSKKSMAWAPMAFYDGKLLFRDQEKMVCVDLTRLE